MTPSGESLFAPTRWSLVQQAQGKDPASRMALAELCEAYWPPVFRYLRARGLPEDAARERTQAFFAHLLEGGRLVAATSGRGRFRSYLLGALRHFESDQRERESRLKRGGGSEFLPIEETEASWVVDDPVEVHRFDREWASEIVRRAFESVAAGDAAAGRKAQFERLKGCLGGAELPPHGQIARELGISEGAVKVAVHRLRQRFREAVRSEIAQTLPAGADLEEELRYLIEVLAENHRRPEP